jgi:regulatory protein
MAPSYTVTGLHEHPRHRGRFTIEVDGEEVAVVGIEAIADLALQTGKSLTSADRGALETANRRTHLFDKSLDLLAVRARSTRDLRVRLRRASAPESDVEWVLSRLQSLGYLDDSSFARQVAHSRIMNGGTSKRGIVTELYKRGIPREIADEAIEATLADVELDEYAAAVAAAQKRVRSMGQVDPVVRRRRLYAFLARRGYEPDVARRVVRDVLSAVE